MTYTQRWLANRHPDQKAWLEAHTRERLGLRPDEAIPEPLSEEARLAQIAERNAAIDARVKAEVERLFPHLRGDGERKAPDNRSDFDREMAAIAEAHIRGRS